MEEKFIYKGIIFDLVQKDSKKMLKSRIKPIKETSSVIQVV